MEKGLDGQPKKSSNNQQMLLLSTLTLKTVRLRQKIVPFL